ncbi:membrane protein [Mycobacterium phage MA5]|uniref:Membrane protein n=1 Tax=Mycobacterium phage MA5 TaxID=2725640 RepID=A0A6M3T1V9_9CAUD|nr:membrane protein [Mycobacterium phage MA5]QJD52137.1 membrane protein [Mycobacterium phage MA5]
MSIEQLFAAMIAAWGVGTYVYLLLEDA